MKYVIGANELDFIKITNNLLYDGRRMWNEVKSVEYEIPLDEATIIKNYDEAKRVIEDIQNNTENIKFFNHSIIGEILDREHSFDKVSYSKELKIYELMPVEVKSK